MSREQVYHQKNESLIDIKLFHLQRKPVFQKYCQWKGYDSFTTEKMAENINPEEIVSIPIDKAKEWGIL